MQREGGYSDARTHQPGAASREEPGAGPGRGRPSAALQHPGGLSGLSSRPAAVPLPLVGASGGEEILAAPPALAAAAAAPTRDRSPAAGKRPPADWAAQRGRVSGPGGTIPNLQGDRGSPGPGEYEQVSVTHVTRWLFRDCFLQTLSSP